MRSFCSQENISQHDGVYSTAVGYIESKFLDQVDASRREKVCQFVVQADDPDNFKKAARGVWIVGVKICRSCVMGYVMSAGW